MHDDWRGGFATRDHTFTVTGRPAKLRERISFRSLFRSGDLTPDDFDAFLAIVRGESVDQDVTLRIEDVIVRAMFVDPVILPAGSAATDDAVPIDVLDDTEIQETVLLAMEGLAAAGAARFRGVDARDGRRAGSGDVADDAEPAARPRAGKRGGAAGRRRSRADDGADAA